MAGDNHLDAAAVACEGAVSIAQPIGEDMRRFASPRNRVVKRPRIDFAGRFASREIGWPRAEFAFVADFAGRFASRALPETRVTLHSGHMGNTSGILGRPKCHGRSVTKWMK